MCFLLSVLSIYAIHLCLLNYQLIYSLYLLNNVSQYYEIILE
jgi:hypothetical protein